MTYCINCGQKIPDDAFFCPKCGAKTQKGIEANVAPSAEELREAFKRVGVEFERAFLLVAKEMHTAVQKATENTQSKPKTVECQNCKAKMLSNAIYCQNCGTKQSSKT